MPDDRLVYIFMSSLDETSIKRETKENKKKIVKMGGEETTYVEEAWTIVGLDVKTPREKCTGLDGVPDAAGYAIARTVEPLAVLENWGRVGNERSGGGGKIPHMVLLASGRVLRRVDDEVEGVRLGGGVLRGGEGGGGEKGV